MMKPAINIHRINNYLLRLRSISELIVEDGDQFLDEEVCNDIHEAIEGLKEEFLKKRGEHDRTKPQ